MKILITGAHFTPAVAVIEELKKDSKNCIVYVGRATTMEGDKTESIESKVLPLIGAKFIPIITGRLQRSFTVYTFFSLLKIPIGFLQSIYIILIEKPDVILSFGGYVAVPVVISGWLFSIPIIVHEQTLVLGLSNKISSYFATKLAFAFLGDRKLDSRSVVTGNPIRNSVINPNKSIASDYKNICDTAIKNKLPLIFIVGGNQGSHIINLAVEGIISKLTKIACVIHVAGNNKYKDFERLNSLGNFNNKYLVKKWVGDEYGFLLQKSDLIISRAGINTLTELAYFEKPSLVIPIPYLYSDEQNKNAIFFKNLGIIEILHQSKLSKDTLLVNIKSMLSNLKTYKYVNKFLEKKVIENASKRLALETILLSGKSSN